jgi:hypothetical protein
MGSTEIHLREIAESVHCIAMLLPNTSYIKKPRVSKEYPANTTQTGSLMSADVQQGLWTRVNHLTETVERVQRIHDFLPGPAGFCGPD